MFESISEAMKCQYKVSALWQLSLKVTGECMKDGSCSLTIRVTNFALLIPTLVFYSVSEIRDLSAVSCNRNYESITVDAVLLIGFTVQRNWVECDGSRRTSFCGAGGSKARKTEPYRCGWIFTPLTAGSRRCQVWKRKELTWKRETKKECGEEKSLTET